MPELNGKKEFQELQKRKCEPKREERTKRIGSKGKRIRRNYWQLQQQQQQMQF